MEPDIISMYRLPINIICCWISHRQHFSGCHQHHRIASTLQSEVDTSNQHERGVLRKLQTSGSSECHRASHWNHNTYLNGVRLQSINIFCILRIFGLGVPSRYKSFRCVLAYVQPSHKHCVRYLLSNIYDQNKVQFVDCVGVRSDHKPSYRLFFSGHVTSIDAEARNEARDCDSFEVRYPVFVLLLLPILCRYVCCYLSEDIRITSIGGKYGW